MDSSGAPLSWTPLNLASMLLPGQLVVSSQIILFINSLLLPLIIGEICAWDKLLQWRVASKLAEARGGDDEDDADLTMIMIMNVTVNMLMFMMVFMIMVFMMQRPHPHVHLELRSSVCLERREEEREREREPPVEEEEEREREQMNKPGGAPVRGGLRARGGCLHFSLIPLKKKRADEPGSKLLTG